MHTLVSKRPRNVNRYQAAAILYGDWGTSKAYVIGLAFAVSGYSSFWLIVCICLLMALVGLNYITICEYSPSGGGVYTSARKHSQVLALLGAFFLLADYLVTASLSALSCFEYLGVANPYIWAIAAIFVVGAINFFGPKHSGNIAFLIAFLTVVVVVLLALISLPYLGDAIRETRPLQEGFTKNWIHFAAIIVALSGVEAIANTTGVMRLDRGSSAESPSVYKGARFAILCVMAEVCFFTGFFGLMINAIPGLTIEDNNINAPDASHIRDSMLRYMGSYFVSNFWAGPEVGLLFGYLISGIFGILLLSAVNTAIVALVSLLFVMSRDGEMPEFFQQLTPFGVPRIPLLLATLTPAIILCFVHDLASLANLYAVGFVGAITTNLGVNAADRSLPMSKLERYSMWVTFVIMFLIEVTLFIEKPDARRFALTVVTIGLIFRMLVVEYRQKQWASKKIKLKQASLYIDDVRAPLHMGAILCAVRSMGKTLDFAIQEAKKYEQPLYVLFIREQKVITEQDRDRLWIDDPQASELFDYAKDSMGEASIKFFYTVSDSPAQTIVEAAQKLHVSCLILGRSRHSMILQILRGNIIQEVSEILPSNIDLLVIS